MKKQVIAVDFDDVLLDFNRGFLASHNKLYGTTLTFEELVNYDNWEEVYGCDKETMADRARAFYHSPEHQEVEPVLGALEGIKTLAQSYSLEIVTSRPETVREKTLEWLNRHFPGYFNNYHFTNIYAGEQGVRAKSKSEVCRSIGAVVIIDDALRHAKDVAKSGIIALLPDRPWNQGALEPNIHRMHSWKEITRWVQENV